VRNPGRLVTRETLLTEVWGQQYTSDTGYLRLFLSQLRKKLEVEPSAPKHLVTEAGMGYRFVPDETSGDD
jgi:two-component system KDP operon response regulator KdpE